MKFKLFTFLKEKHIIETVKEKVLLALKDKKDIFKEYALKYIQEKSPIAKEKLIDFIMEHICLPIYLKPFKGLVKKALVKNLDKISEFITEQIRKY